MSHARIFVEFDGLPGEDDFVLEQLTRELATDLGEVGEVEPISLPAGADDKGAVEVAVAALGVLASAEPPYLQAVVETVVAFLNRNAGRRAHLRVADIELSIDRPSTGEVVEMIKIVQAAVERAGADGTDR